MSKHKKTIESLRKLHTEATEEELHTWLHDAITELHWVTENIRMLCNELSRRSPVTEKL